MNAADLATLTALLNIVIPGDAARKLPGAGEIDFVAYVREHNIEAFVLAGLASLEKGAVVDFRATFAELAPDQQVEIVRATEKGNAVFFRAFVRHVVQCYYQDERVLRGVGTESRPPFPDGYRVDEGDLTLLEPVCERLPLYRS